MKPTAQLNNEALDYKFFPGTSLKIYLRACIGILDKAQLAFQNGDLQRAYVFYVRYLDLCTNKLSKHPEYLDKQQNQTPEIALHRQEYLQLIKLEVPAVLRITEDLRNQIDEEYKRHQLALAKNIAKSKIQNPKSAKLPSTFDDELFNHSISYFHRTTAISNYPPRSSNSLKPKETNSSIHSSDSHYYPELPQLSFSTV